MPCRRLLFSLSLVGLVWASAGPAGASRPPTEYGQLHQISGAISVAVDINDAGQVVGVRRSWSQAGDERAVLWGRESVELGTLGGKTSYPRQVTERGLVVGDSQTASGDTHGFVWTSGHMRDIGTLGGGTSHVLGVNDAGTVVGASAPVQGLDWPFEWVDGIIGELPCPSGRGPIAGSALTVNDAGVVGGQCRWGGGTVPVLWVDGMPRVLPRLPGGYHGGVWDINRHGVAVGGSNASGVIGRPVLWRDGRVVDLGTLGGNWGWATGINDRGEVIGFSTRVTGETIPFLWRDGTMTALPIGSARFAAAESINERGQVVGYASDDQRSWRALLWQDGQAVELAGPPGSTSVAAFDINNRGVAVGTGTSAAFAPETALAWVPQHRLRLSARPQSVHIR